MPPEFDVRFQDDGVVGLRERVEEFVHGYGLAGFVAFLEIAPLEHLCDVVLRREVDPAHAAERLQPFGVEAHDRLLRVEDLENLRLVSLGVPVDLLHRQRRPRLRAAGRIADQGRERADDIHNGVPEILEVFHLPDQHGVTEVKIRSSRIEPDLHDEWLASLREPFQLRPKFRGADDVHASASEIGQLLVLGHRHQLYSRARRDGVMPLQSAAS